MPALIKLFLGGILLVLIVIQFIPPDLPDVTMDNKNDLIINAQVPDEVQSILKNSCYDCHSNETTYPWYSYIAPVKWLIVKDINEGREELNFSEWESLNLPDKISYLDDMAEEVEEDHMPLPVYTVVHWDAKLNDNEKEKLINWTTQYTSRILGE